MVSMGHRIDRGPLRTGEWYGTARIADVLSGGGSGVHECPLPPDVRAGATAG
ncbi:hypothetical protein GCM10023336_44610 [Streptomyces similanensis]|uniref:Uncharacterized protein n=1 Tax=Streptomyces similanensis TaxID=1274988 RepID=A0ABP9KV85_9ACTN